MGESNVKPRRPLGFQQRLGMVDIQNRPACVSSTQYVINLSGFNNDMGSKRILNVATPTMGTDAATKANVDFLKADIAKLKTDYVTLLGR